jgi:hypothetical protein
MFFGARLKEARDGTATAGRTAKFDYRQEEGKE